MARFRIFYEDRLIFLQKSALLPLPCEVGDQLLNTEERLRSEKLVLNDSRCGLFHAF